MASAGRILIMPKGKYNAETEYEMLDLVEHNNRAWIAKKDCVGIEPSDTNKEYWHDMFDKGLAYLPLIGGEVTGSIIANQSAGDALFAKRTIDGVKYENSIGGASTLTINGENVADFTFREEGVSRAQLLYNEKGVAFVDKVNFPSSGGVYLLYGEHNKPYKAYDGNKIADGRTINTGGIGKALLVWSNYGAALVTPVGAFCFRGTAVSSLPAAECYYDGGNLTINTTSDFLNGNYTYHCKCL